MSSVLKFFKSDKKKKQTAHYLEISEISGPTQAGYLKLMKLPTFIFKNFLLNAGET